MDSLPQIESNLDELIQKTLIELKIEAIANIIEKVNSHHLKAKKVNFSIYALTSNLYDYDPEQCFKEAFYVSIENEDTEEILLLKEECKSMFMFAMKYLPTSFYLDFQINEIKVTKNNAKLIENLVYVLIDGDNIGENIKKVKSELEKRNIYQEKIQIEAKINNISKENNKVKI